MSSYEYMDSHIHDVKLTSCIYVFEGTCFGLCRVMRITDQHDNNAVVDCVPRLNGPDDKNVRSLGSERTDFICAHELCTLTHNLILNFLHSWMLDTARPHMFRHFVIPVMEVRRWWCYGLWCRMKQRAPDEINGIQVQYHVDKCIDRNWSRVIAMNGDIYASIPHGAKFAHMDQMQIPLNAIWSVAGRGLLTPLWWRLSCTRKRQENDRKERFSDSPPTVLEHTHCSGTQFHQRGRKTCGTQSTRNAIWHSTGIEFYWAERYISFISAPYDHGSQNFLILTSIQICELKMYETYCIIKEIQILRGKLRQSWCRFLNCTSFSILHKGMRPWVDSRHVEIIAVCEYEVALTQIIVEEVFLAEKKRNLLPLRQSQAAIFGF